jgi:hypothetical protein
MATGDDIGSRGEAIFQVRLTRLCGRKRPFFRPHFLGAKFATLDFMIELIDSGPAAFFFVQVKTTTRGYTKRDEPPRLKVGVSLRDVRRLLRYPAPTYVVGIDEPTEKGFIVSVHGTRAKAISSLTSKYPLDCGNLRRLWEEVRAFWEGRDMVRRSSVFSG